MALTSAQRAKVREYLGWAALGHLTSGPGYRLESSMNALSNLPEDETRITTLLTKLADIDTRLEGSYDRLKASAVGSITLNPAEVSMLRSEGRRLCRTMAAILGVAVRACKFGGGGANGAEVING